MGSKFTWSEEKNAINIVKHGISFNTAKRVFSDPMMIEAFDWEHSHNENRWKAVGFVGSKLLRVIFTEKNNQIRIITARKADNNDEEDYFYGHS